MLLTQISCVTGKKEDREDSDFQIIGHRGFAGRYPQNTLPAFLNAVKAGVDAIEMDVVISADRQVVVSHEPYMAEYMLTPAGKSISAAETQNYKLYEMSYKDIKKFDAGTALNKKYPLKRNFRTYKPLLEEVILNIENYTTQKELSSQRYYIELKSSPGQYGISQPDPSEFVDLVLEVIKKHSVEDRAVLQSFDPHLLNLLHQKRPDLRVSFLVNKKNTEEQLARLDFIPHIYSPHYKLVEDEAFVEHVKEKNMKLIPWTVNSSRRLKLMKQLGVDGVITDHPRKAVSLLRR